MKRTYTFVTFLLSAIMLTMIGCKKHDIGPDNRDNYVGTWQVVDQCSFDTITYDIYIEKKGNNDLIIFEGAGLYNIGYVVEAVVTGGKIVIPIQQFQITTTPDLYYEFYEGNGSLAGDELRVSYTVFTYQDGIINSTDQCVAIMTRQ